MSGAAKAMDPAIVRVVFLFELGLSAIIFATITSHLELDTGTEPMVSRCCSAQPDEMKKTPLWMMHERVQWRLPEIPDHHRFQLSIRV